MIPCHVQRGKNQGQGQPELVHVLNFLTISIAYYIYRPTKNVKLF